jgi:hypothetical protein
MTVTQTDLGEGNIVFELYRPPWTVCLPPTALWCVAERLKARAKVATRANGQELPTTGAYLIVIGSRGGGEYMVRVEAR